MEAIKETALRFVANSRLVHPTDFLELSALSAPIHKEVRPLWIIISLHLCWEGRLPRTVDCGCADHGSCIA